MTPEDLLTDINTIWYQEKLWRARGRELQWATDSDTPVWDPKNVVLVPRRFGNIVAIGWENAGLVVVAERALLNLNVCEDHGPHIELVTELKPCLKA